MSLSIYQVDAFASRPFSGNPAAVVVEADALDEVDMQHIAAENNLAETAFVTGSEGQYRIRWFTPTVEVDLCGHATLAAAHVFFSHLGFAEETITFASKSGGLHVRRDGQQLVLDFPADTLKAVDAPTSLTAALGFTPQRVFRGRDDYLAVLDQESEVATLSPDLQRVAELDARGLIITAPGDQVDFVSRFYAPQSGIPEDPVTGSAHTTLTPLWSDELGKKELIARQISPRGGELICRDCGDRVEIGGQAVTYLVGQISV